MYLAVKSVVSSSVRIVDYEAVIDRSSKLKILWQPSKRVIAESAMFFMEH